MMSHFEQLANDIDIAVGTAKQRIVDFGYDVDVRSAVSCIKAGFVIWLIAQEEDRNKGSFRKCVIDKLPNDDCPKWENYISPSSNFES